MEFIREDCIYARQSVDRKDSISIESQIDFCKYELKGGVYYRYRSTQEAELHQPFSCFS